METTFERRALGTTVLVAVHGEVDILSAPDFKAALLEAGPNLAVDLTDCGYLDSSGLAVLVSTYKAQGRHALPVVVPNDSFLRKVFNVSGIESLLILCDSLEAIRTKT